MDPPLCAVYSVCVSEIEREILSPRSHRHTYTLWYIPARRDIGLFTVTKCVECVLLCSGLLWPTAHANESGTKQCANTCVSVCLRLPVCVSENGPHI